MCFNLYLNNSYIKRNTEATLRVMWVIGVGSTVYEIVVINLKATINNRLRKLSLSEV